MAFITMGCKQIQTKIWHCGLCNMAPLNKKDSTEKQIRQITKQLKANGAVISEIAENIEEKKGKKAPGGAINPSLN
jgi:hypothetical protein